MLRKVFSIIALAVILCVSSAVTVFADAGPKPSFNIRFSGIGIKEEYIGAILSQEPEFGNDIAYDINSTDLKTMSVYEVYDEHSIDKYDKFFKALSDYNCDDGYKYISFISFVTTQKGIDGTFLPDSFKVLLYSPKTNSFSTSEKLSAYAYYSAFDVQVEKGKITSVSHPTLIKSGGSNFIIGLGLLVSMILTVAVELLIAALMKIRNKRQICTIIITNIVSLSVLNLFIYCLNPPVYGTLFSFPYIFFELGVVIVETAAYLYFLRKYDKELSVLKIIIYTIIANTATYIIAEFLPRIPI